MVKLLIYTKFPAEGSKAHEGKLEGRTHLCRKLREEFEKSYVLITGFGIKSILDFAKKWFHSLIEKRCYNFSLMAIML